MSSLTRRNIEILEWIQEFCERNQFFPTYREIQRGFSYKSVSSVQNQVRTLKKLGFIVNDSNKARTLRLAAFERSPESEPQGIPIRGVIAAGGFVETFTDVKAEYIPRESFCQASRGCERFALRVKGDSMIGANILHDDVVILDKRTDLNYIKDRTIVAARLKDENQTTLKRWHENNSRVSLIPENPNYPTIQIKRDDVLIEGIYAGLVRGII